MPRSCRILAGLLDVPREMLVEMYRRMVRIREFELAAIDLFKRGHVSSHGHNIAKGANTDRMMAEILSKETGYCKGRGGSMHIAAFETGSLGALAVVGKCWRNRT